MNREETLYELQRGLDLIKLMTWEHGGLGNYTQQEVQEICDRWKEMQDYIKNNLK